MKVTYFGQACTLIETDGRKVLTDPWLTEGAYFGTWFHTHLLEDAGVSPATFPKDIDYLFLSHEHQDHVDPATLREFAPDIPVLICKFPSDRFRRYLQGIGLTNIRELESGESVDLGGTLRITLFRSAEYTNDSAILVEGEGYRVFNETDCKLSYEDLRRIGEKGVDLGFYMFSGANWYPIMYDYPEEDRVRLVQRRRSLLMKSFLQRVKVTRPRVATPAAGPCTVLDPDLLWLNSTQQGIFVDPREAVEAVRSAGLNAEPLVMAASDVWEGGRGFQRRSPDSFLRARSDYIADASRRMAPRILQRRQQEPPAGSDLPRLLEKYFQERVAAQTPAVRKRINARLAFEVTGPMGGCWTIDFCSGDSGFVREGLAPGWTYKVRVEDKLIYPFVAGREEFLEDLFLSLRVHLSRRPDEYNEPLYHFLYDPDPERMHNWYASR